MKRVVNYMLLGLVMVFLHSCEEEQKPASSIVNFEHLLHLYQEVDLPNGKPAGIFHIYSEYPDYNYEIEPREGYTCVDDVARAMVVRSMNEKMEEFMPGMYDRTAEFLLYMQHDNGYFNNFVWHDLSINDTFRTTVAEPNWWSWRALWALSDFESEDQELQKRVQRSCKVLVENIFNEYLDQEMDTLYSQGLAFPSWLPLKTAGDQAALLMVGLIGYHKNIEADPRIAMLIEKFADGLLLTQQGGPGQFPYGAYLSWRNIWHAYGNAQAYAMLLAGEFLNRKEYTESALTEIDHFYPYLQAEKYLSHFIVEKEDGIVKPVEIHQTAQIAYGFRPMIWACLKAWELTQDNKYLNRAYDIAKWFAGNNIAGTVMYDPATGRCYDGIVSSSEVNLNAGSESTIEALLAIQMLEDHFTPEKIGELYE